MKMLCKIAQSMIFFLVGGVHILYDKMIQKWLLGRLEATVWFPKDWEGHELQRVYTLFVGAIFWPNVAHKLVAVSGTLWRR